MISSDQELDGSLIIANQIRIRILRKSIERISRNTGRKTSKISGEPSIVPLMTYLDQLSYTGLYLGILRLSWDLVCSRTQCERETLQFLLTTHFPNLEVTQELAATAAALLVRRSD